MVFMHIAIPLFLLIGMFIHIKRLKQARTDPARGLAIGTMLSLAVVHDQAAPASWPQTCR